MNLLDIYNLMQKGEMTVEQAAVALGMNTRNLKIRMGRLGHRLPIVLATLDKIKRDEISRSEAAEILGVEVRNVNALSASWNVRRPIREYMVDRIATELKWDVHNKYAVDYIGEHLSLDEASEKAGVSTRQMRRIVSKLLKEHDGSSWKDLSPMTLSNRRRLSEDISNNIGLEKARREVAESIALGSRTIHDQAVDLIVARRERRQRSAKRV